ncbi:MAG: iron ABC transporter permease [Candidatus Mcinerneyibacterium aminivorans]|uniref:Iron ABC transporter permease n=1 Tax=Candidatus Mcinerneyibacterium aminivorans TaxID=2703815 RepID=A0A5D0MHG8_9BACT|nr:MAG: iron ABC transporter permease [Candidatus Mcinerneyibacterium aminivorans]
MNDSMKKYIFIIFILIFILLPFIGADFIGLDEIINKVGEYSYIFWNLRVPRVIFAFLIGGILTLSGLIFQSVFKNDLATPFTLGVASGASFGAVLSIHLNIVFNFFIFHSRYVFAFIGALISVFLILTILKIKKDYSVSTILLAGIAINFLFSSLILFFQYVMNNAKLGSAVRWMMGNISIYEYRKIYMIIPFYLLIIAAGYIYRHQLDIMYLGDELAISKGVEVHNLRKKLFIFISIIVAAAVSLSGPIGFVGLIIPHLLKLAFGRDHSKLVFYSLFFGGIFLAVTDTVARTIISPAEMPVGIITAMLGVPFFLYLLMKR